MEKEKSGELQILYLAGQSILGTRNMYSHCWVSGGNTVLLPPRQNLRMISLLQLSASPSRNPGITHMKSQVSLTLGSQCPEKQTYDILVGVLVR